MAEDLRLGWNIKDDSAELPLHGGKAEVKELLQLIASSQSGGLLRRL